MTSSLYIIPYITDCCAVIVHVLDGIWFQSWKHKPSLSVALFWLQTAICHDQQMWLVDVVVGKCFLCERIHGSTVSTQQFLCTKTVFVVVYNSVPNQCSHSNISESLELAAHVHTHTPLIFWYQSLTNTLLRQNMFQTSKTSMIKLHFLMDLCLTQNTLFACKAYSDAEPRLFLASA